MFQQSKLLRSREEWKAKALQRGEALRESRKTQKRYRQKLAELKQELARTSEPLEAEKKH